MLCQAQIDRFHRDGFLVLRQVVGREELDLLRLAADRVEADGVAGLGQHHHYRSSPAGLKLYCCSERVWERDPIFLAATAHPCLLQAVGQCLGHSFLPLAASLTCKIRFSKVPDPWHQDPPYGDPGRQATSPIPDLAASICLDQTTVENGCIWSLPGHHLAGHLELGDGAEEVLYARACPAEMAPGDLLLQCASTPRAARGNPSPRTWRALRLHYLTTSVADDGYPTPEGGKGLQGLGLAGRMLELRQSLSLADPESPHLTLGEEGFTFTGQPCTPPRHWETLIRQFSPEEIQRKKLLMPD